MHVVQHKTQYWHNVVAKAGGFVPVVVASGLDEELALLAEVELIAKHKAQGGVLVNLTDGGEGMSGYLWPKEAIHLRAEKQRGQLRPSVGDKLRGRQKSEEHRRALSEAKIGKLASEETRAKMSATRKGMPFKIATCFNCGRSMHIAAATRWHMNNCRGK